MKKDMKRKQDRRCQLKDNKKVGSEKNKEIIAAKVN